MSSDYKGSTILMQWVDYNSPNAPKDNDGKPLYTDPLADTIQDSGNVDLTPYNLYAKSNFSTHCLNGWNNRDMLVNDNPSVPKGTAIFDNALTDADYINSNAGKFLVCSYSNCSGVNFHDVISEMSVWQAGETAPLVGDLRTSVKYMDQAGYSDQRIYFNFRRDDERGVQWSKSSSNMFTRQRWSQKASFKNKDKTRSEYKFNFDILVYYAGVVPGTNFGVSGYPCPAIYYMFLNTSSSIKPLNTTQIN